MAWNHQLGNYSTIRFWTPRWLENQIDEFMAVIHAALPFDGPPSQLLIFIGSMYWIFTDIYHACKPNVNILSRFDCLVGSFQGLASHRDCHRPPRWARSRSTRRLSDMFLTTDPAALRGTGWRCKLQPESGSDSCNAGTASTSSPTIWTAGDTVTPLLLLSSAVGLPGASPLTWPLLASNAALLLGRALSPQALWRAAITLVSLRATSFSSLSPPRQISRLTPPTSHLRSIFSALPVAVDGWARNWPGAWKQQQESQVITPGKPISIRPFMWGRKIHL